MSLPSRRAVTVGSFDVGAVGVVGGGGRVVEMFVSDGSLGVGLTVEGGGVGESFGGEGGEVRVGESPDVVDDVVGGVPGEEGCPGVLRKEEKGRRVRTKRARRRFESKSFTHLGTKRRNHNRVRDHESRHLLIDSKDLGEGDDHLFFSRTKRKSKVSFDSPPSPSPLLLSNRTRRNSHW